MAPKKRQSEAEEEQPKPELAVRRVTRSSTRQADAKPAVVSRSELPKKKKVKTVTKKVEKAEENVVAEEKEETGKPEEEEKGKVEEDEKKGDNGDELDNKRTIVVEYCKQCNSFKTRAFQVRDGVEKGVSGVMVKLNPDKPRRGCFEIREEGGETFISLLDMKRPFKPMKELDMEKVISDIVDKIK
ncbi:hypothetical protein SLE2022_033390 [Rubroshorea leprosula]